jgi:hypothetical protein
MGSIFNYCKIFFHNTYTLHNLFYLTKDFQNKVLKSPKYYFHNISLIYYFLYKKIFLNHIRTMNLF